MAKYTNEQIKAMAKSVLWHKNNGGDEHAILQLIMNVALYTGLQPNEVWKRIENLAKD